MQDKIKIRWTKEEFNNLLKDKKSGSSLEELSKKYNRTVEAIKRKLHRGYTIDGRNRNNPKFLSDEKLVEEFKEDYAGENKLDSDEILKKYDIQDKPQLYTIAWKLGVSKYNINI